MLHVNSLDLSVRVKILHLVSWRQKHEILSQYPFHLGMLASVRGKLVEHNSPKTTRRKQLVENKGRKSRRKQTRRIITKSKLVASKSAK